MEMRKAGWLRPAGDRTMLVALTDWGQDTEARGAPAARDGDGPQTSAPPA